MTNRVYGVVHCNEDNYRPIVIPDGAEDSAEYAWEWYQEDNDAIYLEVVNLNPTDYWVGYFFYNDMEGPEDACPVECNTQEHLDAHWESNNSSGHYECIRYEHRLNDDVIDTINHNFYDLYNE